MVATRRERVVLDLESNVPERMLAGAASTKVLRIELERLSGQYVRNSRAAVTVSKDVDRISVAAVKADRSINQLTGRLRLMADVAAMLGPAVAPLGGVALAGVAGLASQLGFAAVAGGTLIASMRGLGDALGALHEAHLEPTVENLQEAEEALNRLSPAAAAFAHEAYALLPALREMRDMGAEALFPGLTEALDDLERLAPRLGATLEAVGAAMGGIAARSAESLASGRWSGFFEFIADEAPRALAELALAVGDVTHGLAELWQAFAPLNRDFSSWLVNAADAFDEWAVGLAATDGFRDFVDYVRTTGPQVAETVGALANGLIQVVQASAPLGGPVLVALEAVADVIATIADSDLGTPIMAGVAALALLNRSLAVTSALSRTSLSTGMFAGIGTLQTQAKKGAGSIRSLSGDIGLLARNFGTAGAASQRMAAQNKAAADNLKRVGGVAGKAAGAVGGLALATTGVADSMGLNNTVMGAMVGMIGGPWGAAIGGAAGFALDLAAAQKAAVASAEDLRATLDDQTGALTANTAAMVASALESGGTLAIAEQFGVTLRDVTAAALGEEDALARVNAQIDAHVAGLPEVTAGASGAAQEMQNTLNAADKLRGAIGGQNDEVNEAVGSHRRLDAAIESSGDSMKESRLAAMKQAAAMREARKAARETASQFITLGDSLDDAKTSLRGWLRELEQNARDLRNFRLNAEQAAERGLRRGLIAALHEAGPAGARRMRQLANATDEEIARANRAWQRGREEMRRYVNFKVPAKRPEVDISPAMAAINALEGRLNRIADEDVFVNVRHRNFGRDSLGAVGGAVADGGTIPGKRHPYGDKMLMLTAPGEEVISNRYGQADKNRAALKAANDGAKLAVIGYADGGTTGGWPGSVTPSSGGGGGGRRRPGPNSFADIVSPLNMIAWAFETKWLPLLIKSTNKQLEAATKQQEAAQSLVDGTKAQMAALGEATVSGFSTGLFDRDSNPWAAGAGGGWIHNLGRDISGLQQRGSLQAQLAAAGLDGAALDAALSQGTNADLSALLASGGVQRFEDMFIQRQQLQASVGAQAGQFAYGAELTARQAALDQQNAEVRELHQTVKQLERNQRQAEKEAEKREQRREERADRRAEKHAEDTTRGGNQVARRRRRDR